MIIQTRLAKLALSELAFVVRRFLILDIRLWNQMIQDFDLWQLERHHNINIALLRKQLGQVQVSLRVEGDLCEPAVLAHYGYASCGYAIPFSEQTGLPNLSSRVQE